MKNIEEQVVDLCGTEQPLGMQLYAYYTYGGIQQEFDSDGILEVISTIHQFAEHFGIVDAKKITEQHLLDFREKMVADGEDERHIRGQLYEVSRFVESQTYGENKSLVSNVMRVCQNSENAHKMTEITGDYGLSKVTDKKYPIYRQLLNYYKYCSQTCAFSPKTMSAKTNYINYFVKFSGITRLEDISNQQIFDWIDYQKSRNNCGRSINHRLAQLKVMLRWERDDNVQMPNLKISRIPMQKEVPPRKNFFTRKQIQTALLYARGREWLLIKLSFDCGLRIGELVKLRLSDINGRKMKVVGKGSKLRWVIMSKEAKRHLNHWIKQEKISDYLWPAWSGDGHMCQEEARKEMRSVFMRAGFTNFRPHDLRHSFATELKLIGLPTRKIQMAMGHSSEAITERYLSDLDGASIEEIYDAKYSSVILRIKSFISAASVILPRITLKSR